MNFLKTDIAKLAKESDDFRRVIFTAPNSQLVLMTLRPGEEIGLETHENTDQIFYFVSGEGKAIVEGHPTEVEKDDIVVVPAGLPHNIVNRSDHGRLRFFTVYSPPAHAPGTVHRTRKEALADEHDYAPKP